MERMPRFTSQCRSGRTLIYETVSMNLRFKVKGDRSRKGLGFLVQWHFENEENKAKFETANELKCEKTREQLKKHILKRLRKLPEGFTANN